MIHPARRRLGAVVLAIIAMAASSGCNGGPRPTLVAPPGPTSAPALQLELTPAPVDAAPLPAADETLPLESSVDDALLAWAIDRDVPYVDACERVSPQPGLLCDVGTERETVRLLGPSSDVIWYVVTVGEYTSFDSGTGYRVDEVRIAGR